MKQLAVTQFPAPWLIAFSLVLFLSLFSGIIFWTFFVRRKADLESQAIRILNEDDEVSNERQQ